MKIDFSNQKDKKVEIKERNTIQFVDISKISYFKCDGYITTINIFDSAPITVSKLLKDFESELEEYGFIRANRSTLVNLAVVKKYVGGRIRLLELMTGEHIKVSRRNVFKFRECHLCF